MSLLTLKQAAAVAVTALGLAVTAPPPAASAGAAAPEAVALQQLLGGGDLTPPGIEGLRALVAEAATDLAVHTDLNTLVEQVLAVPGIAERWAGAVRTTAAGDVEQARALVAAVAAPAVPAGELERLARTLDGLQLAGEDDLAYLFVRFLLDPRLIASLPVPGGPSLPGAAPGAHHGEYLAWRQGTLASDVQSGPGGGGKFTGYCDGYTKAEAGDYGSRRHYWITGELKFCYDYERVLSAEHPVRIELDHSLEPFAYYKMSGFIQNDGGYASGLDHDGRFREHLTYGWWWQPDFETCYMLGKGCIVHDTPYIAVFGNFDGSTSNEEPHGGRELSWM